MARAAIDSVLQVHTRYRRSGGEDEVVAAERRLLEASGIHVHQLMFDNDDLVESHSPLGDLRLAASAVWSRRAERAVRSAIARHRPQVMHVHNTFFAASPSVYAGATRSGVPIVQTLHNYRLFCPAATAFRDGAACTDCLGRVIPLPGVVHACVRGSRAQSAVAGATVAIHRVLGTWSRRIRVYVALTAFQRDLLIRAGLPRSRVRVISNFLEPDPGTGPEGRRGVLYSGRLSVEKGIEYLLQASESLAAAVRIAGDGPLQSQAELAAASAGTVYLGRLTHDAVLDEIRRAVAVVIPSVWFEGFPMAVVEAYATATPVIASRIGSLAEIVEDGVTGILCEPHDAEGLRQRLEWAIANPEAMSRMGTNARRRYEERYRGRAHLDALMKAYRDAISAGVSAPNA
jgi:glycosyltransferase involved in cell wall biosynthesis